MTRFATLFHSHDAPSVGPVRSARSTDLLFAQPDRPAAVLLLRGQRRLRRPGPQGAAGRRRGGPVPGHLPPGTGPAGPLQPVLRDQGAVRLRRRRRRRRRPRCSATGRRVRRPPRRGRSRPARVQAIWKLNITTTVVFAWDEASKTFKRTTDGAPHLDAAGSAGGARERRVPGRRLPQHRAGRPVGGGGTRGRADRRGRGLGAHRRPARSRAAGAARPRRRRRPTPCPSGEPIKLTPGRTWLELVPLGNLKAL